MASLAAAQTSSWEREVVYQIFPRSFYDSNGDHIGDLGGITQKLGYLRSLGFTAVLINPIFASRMYHNYFADDFLKVDPSLGTNREFFELVRQAHRRRMKVILDMEVQYVADLHPWFKAVERDPKSPVAEMIWMKGSKLFGDKLPGYDGQKIGFATLNPDSSMLKREVLKVFRYWADPDGNPSHGVDGFRIDHMMDDLDSQHVKTGMLKNFWLPIEQQIRHLNPSVLFLAEQSDWGFGADVFAKGKVDAVYAIPLRYAWMTFDKPKIEKALQATMAATPAGKTQFDFLENHDVERYASVVKRDPSLLRLGAVFNLTLKGTPLVYYGQELGMQGIQGKWGTDANDIPVRLAYRWTRKVGGAGSADFYRNSGPWARSGFTRDNDGVSVEEEIGKPDSLLSFYKRLVRLRQSNPALQSGSFALADTHSAHVLGYERVLGKLTVLVLLNLSDKSETVPLATSRRGWRDLWSGDRVSGPTATLGPHGFKIVEFRS